MELKQLICLLEDTWEQMNPDQLAEVLCQILTLKIDTTDPGLVYSKTALFADLSVTERRMYLRLYSACGYVVPVRALRLATWGVGEADYSEDYHKVFICSMRRKLKKHGEEIVNVKGVGYFLRQKAG